MGVLCREEKEVGLRYLSIKYHSGRREVGTDVLDRLGQLIVGRELKRYTSGIYEAEVFSGCAEDVKVGYG